MTPHHHITRCLLALAAALVLTWSEPVWAQSKELRAAFQQYKELKAKGKYAEAIPYAKRFIELAGEVPTNSTHTGWSRGIHKTDSVRTECALRKGHQISIVQQMRGTPTGHDLFGGRLRKAVLSLDIGAEEAGMGDDVVAEFALF